MTQADQPGTPPAGTDQTNLSAQLAQENLAADLERWKSTSWAWTHTPAVYARPVHWLKEHSSAFLSPLFLGLAPFFAKTAYRAGAQAYTVIAMRMILAAGVLWLIYLLFARRYIKSWWLGITLSAFAGTINGLGSICYYQGLVRIDASLASILNITYLVFVTMLLRMMGQAVSRLTVLRLALAVAAVGLLTVTHNVPVDMVGVSLLLIGALAYAVQLVIGQRVLYDIPAPTMTLYSISAMALVVTIAWLLNGGPEFTSLNSAGWEALLAFAGVTTLSRLTLFQGVKKMGSVQTAMLGVSEVLVTVLFAMLFLGDVLVTQQWFGAGLMALSVMLLVAEKDVPRLVPFPLISWVVKLSMLTQRRGRQK